MQSYEELLERALSKVPKQKESDERFFIPKSEIMPAGAKSVIVNFADIASYLRRDVNHLMKYLVKELATSGELEGKKLTVIGRFHFSLVDKKIENYVKEYVICNECGKPDTNIVRDDRVNILKCEACGAKHPVKSV